MQKRQLTKHVMKILITAFGLLIPLWVLSQQEKVISVSSPQNIGDTSKITSLFINPLSYNGEEIVYNKAYDSDDSTLYDKRIRQLGFNEEAFNISNLNDNIYVSLTDMFSDSYYHFFKVLILNGSSDPIVLDSLHLSLIDTKPVKDPEYNFNNGWHIYKKLSADHYIKAKDEGFLVYSVPTSLLSTQDGYVLMVLTTLSRAKASLKIGINKINSARSYIRFSDRR